MYYSRCFINMISSSSTTLGGKVVAAQKKATINSEYYRDT